MPTKLIFATKSDLEPGLRAIEARFPLKYVRAGFWRTPEYTAYTSALDIAELETANDHIVAALQGYLVMLRSAEIFVRSSPQDAGGIHYMIEREHNPQAFIFKPGGWYEGKLMGGFIYTSQVNPPEVVELCRHFIRTVTKGFVKLLGYYDRGYRSPWWVGPEALRALDSGVRLVTYDAQEQYAYLDLKRPERL
jgi:hypothetical protein